MRLLFPRSRRRGLLRVLAGCCALSCLAPEFAASTPTASIEVHARGAMRSNINAGTQLLEEDVELRQAPDTLIRADKADGSNLARGYGDGHWILTGKVHIEFNGAVLDADRASVVFADGHIYTIEAQGKPARFSRPAKTVGQRSQGRANTITYDATKRQLRFIGHPWYSFGPYEGTADQPLVYNLDSTELFTEKSGSNDSRINFTFRNMQASARMWRSNSKAGTQLLEQDVELRQAPDTLIRTDKAEGSNLTEGYDDSHWILTGKVHIEFNGATLDATTATVVFAGSAVRSIQVQGSPALFSQPGKIPGQRDEGRADTISFDSQKRQVRFTGPVSYSFGRNQSNSDQPMLWDLDSSILSSEGGDPASRVRITIHPADKHVPAPHAPERSGAQ